MNYGAPGEEPVYVPDEKMGDSANTPLVEGTNNTYYVDYLFSYNLGIHIIANEDLEIVGYSAYIAKGGPVVNVDELVNGKTVAKIEPLEGATLVVFAPEDWTSTTTVAQKAALFTEVVGVNAFQGVSTTASNTYDLVIGTIYNENTYLIHITKCEVYERGWHFVITGEVK